MKHTTLDSKRVVKCTCDVDLAPGVPETPFACGLPKDWQ